ncbi:MAG: lysophospholipid acyltransferase family protein [Thermomicrobiales bacterium]|jgi:1-acyl-sn-glycerol-3-phosphate acyltransferase|nr:lysophospholipid acyltransferase family protein [Thermomicrobiales bacterium]
MRQEQTATGQPVRRAAPSPRRWLKRAAYEALRLVVNIAARPLLGMRVSGTRNLPRSGPVIVVANHLHNFDLIVLSAALSRPVLYMAKRELFAQPASAWLLGSFFGAFPVNRGTPDRAALRQARTLLDAGQVVGILPEGTRSPTATLMAGNPGVALIAMQSGAPVLPVGITGTEHLPFDAKARRAPWFGRTHVRVVVGQPFRLPPRQPGEKVDLAAATDRIMREIAALLPPEYRGVYGDRR